MSAYEAAARETLLREHHVSREIMAHLERYVAMVIGESANQNLISATSATQIWHRHILDSAQLLGLAKGAATAAWLDLGSGAGFPGLVIGIVTGAPVTLVESRRKRIEFLRAVVDALGLAHVRIYGGEVETMPPMKAGVITARAFAPLPKLFGLACRFSTTETQWILPKGRSAHEELEAARESWQGVFHVKQSMTDSDAKIILAQQVRPKGNII